ncbi:MAG: alpha/beta hydrolase fold domain-containing protein [Acidimicrobiales bacterium]
MPTLYLLLACWGALATLLALFRVRWLPQLSFPILMVAWPTSEWPLFHIGWQVLATVGFAFAGAFDNTVGLVGLAISLVSWVGLIQVYRIGRRARPTMAGAFEQELGPRYLEELEPDRRESLRDEPDGGWSRLPLHFDRAGIVIDHDRSYGDDPKRHLLDIYRPAQTGDRAPVIVQIHGGAWVTGHKQQQGQPLLHRMARQGYVGVAINYRLGPKARFPDPIVDVKRAIAWVKEHITEYGGDPDTVFLTGGSAGGHLASLAALTAGVADFQPGFADADTTVVGCMPFYGPADMCDRYGIRGRFAAMEPFLKRMVMPGPRDVDPGLWDQVSPISHVRADAPPFFIIQGENDVLVYREETRRFADELRRVSQQSVVYWEVPGAQHAFDTFNSARSSVAVDGVETFVAHVLATRIPAA